jgi:hypothetical protein
MAIFDHQLPYLHALLAALRGRLPPPEIGGTRARLAPNAARRRGAYPARSGVAQLESRPARGQLWAAIDVLRNLGGRIEPAVAALEEEARSAAQALGTLARELREGAKPCPQPRSSAGSRRRPRNPRVRASRRCAPRSSMHSRDSTRFRPSAPTHCGRFSAATSPRRPCAI